MEGDKGGRNLRGRWLHVVDGGGVHVDRQYPLQIAEFFILLSIDAHANLRVVLVNFPLQLSVVPLDIHSVAHLLHDLLEAPDHENRFRRDSMAHVLNERQRVVVHVRLFEGAEGIHFLEPNVVLFIVVVHEFVLQIVRRKLYRNAVVSVQLGIVFADQKVYRATQARKFLQV